jgi:hypothetical protein
VSGGFVAAFDDFAREIRRLVYRMPDHERGHFDLVLVEQIQDAWDAFIYAVFKEGVRGQIR